MGYAIVVAPVDDTVTIIDSVTFTNIAVFNFTGDDDSEGGGAFITSVADLTIEDSGFTSNAAGTGWNGGAVRVENPTDSGISGSVAITGSVFESNLADQGGAASIDSPGSVTVTGSTFLLNHASPGEGGGGGGALRVYDAQEGGVQITSSRFSENISDVSAGAVFLDLIQGPIGVETTTFEHNTADTVGGAVVVLNDVEGPTFSVADSEFIDNTATNGADQEGGGAIYMNTSGGGASITRSQFLENKSDERGAAVFVGTVNVDTMFTILQSTFARNDLTFDGRRGISVHIGDNNGVVDVSDSTLDEAGGEDVEYAFDLSSNDGELFSLRQAPACIRGKISMSEVFSDKITNTAINSLVQ